LNTGFCDDHHDKTLPGRARVGSVCKEKYAKKSIRQFSQAFKAVRWNMSLPQGGVFHEALQPLQTYQSRSSKTRRHCRRNETNGYRLISGGTDNHLMLVTWACAA